MKKTLFMETTEVPASRTAGEVSSELIKGGATQIATSYDNGKVIGLLLQVKERTLERFRIAAGASRALGWTGLAA